MASGKLFCELKYIHSTNDLSATQSNSVVDISNHLRNNYQLLLCLLQLNFLHIHFTALPFIQINIPLVEIIFTLKQINQHSTFQIFICANQAFIYSNSFFNCANQTYIYVNKKNSIVSVFYCFKSVSNVYIDMHSFL